MLPAFACSELYPWLIVVLSLLGARLVSSATRPQASLCGESYCIRTWARVHHTRPDDLILTYFKLLYNNTFGDPIKSRMLPPRTQINPPIIVSAGSTGRRTVSKTQSTVRQPKVKKEKMVAQPRTKYLRPHVVVPDPKRFFEEHKKCYQKEARTILEGKHWEGKNRCVKLSGDDEP